MENEKNAPTQKQADYAASIARTLNIKLPEEKTRAAYKDFISANQERFSQTRTPKVHFTDDQIARANAVSVLDYARSQGLELQRDGKDYRVKNYSGGFIISPGKNNWNWFGGSQGGGVVQLCMFLENKTWQEAVGTLLNEDMEPIRHAPDWKPEPEPPKEFHLPERNDTNKHVYAYLTKTRGIDAEIVKDMLDKGYIYENRQRSCVFVGRDNEGVPRHASVRSTNTSGKAYKKDVSGSQKKYSFSISGTSGNLNVFEAPIDALSYMSLQKLSGNRPDDSYLSLGGVSDKALEQYLEDHKDIKQITVCTDGDEAGEKAADRIYEKYGDAYEIIRSRSKHKDFNEDLVAIAQEENFRVSLHEVVTGKKKVSDSILIGTTPNILSVCGATKGMDFTISKTAIDKCMRPEKRNAEGKLEGKTGHGLTEEQLYSALMNVKEPVMVLKGNRENSLVVITEYSDDKNRPIVVSVVLDKKSGRTMVNNVSSVYGRDKFEEYIQRQIQADNVLAIDNKKAESLLQPIGKWYPKRGEVISYDATVAYSLENVKYPEEINQEENIVNSKNSEKNDDQEVKTMHSVEERSDMDKAEQEYWNYLQQQVDSFQLYEEIDTLQFDEATPDIRNEFLENSQEEMHEGQAAVESIDKTEDLENIQEPNISISNYESNKPGQVDFDVNIGEDEVHRGQAAVEDDGTVNWVFVDPVPLKREKGVKQQEAVEKLKIDWDKVIGKVTELLQKLMHKSKDFIHTLGNHTNNRNYTQSVQSEVLAETDVNINSNTAEQMLQEKRRVDEKIAQREWNPLLENDTWMKLEQPRSLSPEFFDIPDIKDVQLLYELENSAKQEIVEDADYAAKIPDGLPSEFYAGVVDGEKRLIFKQYFADHEIFYTSRQATVAYMSGSKSLKEIAAGIYEDFPDMVSLTVDEGHLNHVSDEDMLQEKQQEGAFAEQNIPAYYLDFKEREVSDGYLYFTIETPDHEKLTGTYRIVWEGDGKPNELVEISNSHRYPEIKEHWKEIRNECHKDVNDFYEYIMRNNFKNYTGEDGGSMRYPLNIGPVPNLLVLCGADNNLRFDIAQSTITGCLEQGMTNEQLFNALNNVKNPVMILQGKEENAFIVVTDYRDDQGQPITVSLEERQGGGIEVKGVYGQKEFAPYLNRQAADGKVMAVDYKKAGALFKSIGGEPPVFGQVIGFDERIAYDMDSIKTLLDAPAEQMTKTVNQEPSKENGKATYTTLSGTEAATKKQIAYAKKIAEALNIDLPEETTKAAYSTFIGENQKQLYGQNPPVTEGDDGKKQYKDYLEMVTKNGSTLKDVPKEHYTDELLLAAVTNWGAAIRMIPEDRITAEIARASVQQYGLNLKHVPEKFRNEEICTAAYISSSGKSVRFTPNDIKDRVKEQGQKRLAEDNKANPNVKRQMEVEHLQEQGREWVSQIDNMLKEHESDPEAMVEDIAFAAKFYQYSSKNIQLMHRQNPHMSYVASASAFEKMGYHVKENEPAMIGRVPVFAKYIKNEKGERIYSWDYTPEIREKLKNGTLKEQQVVKKFQFVAAFYDISQTDCPVEDYPSIFHMGVPSEMHQEAFDAMREFAEKTLGFKVMETDLKSIKLRGSCEPDNKIIRINDKLEATMALSTLCHEIAHGIIHTSENSAKMSTAQKECEADIMDIMLESSLGLPINENRREHLFQYFQSYKKEQAEKERPYEVTLEKLIDRVQTKVFRKYAEDINNYLDLYLPAEGSQNEVAAQKAVKNIALIDSAYDTDHKTDISTGNELFDTGRIENYQELYKQTREEYRLNNSFVPKLAILKSMNGEDFDLYSVQPLDETTAQLISSYPDAMAPESFIFNVEAGNILVFEENVLADPKLYLAKPQGLQDVTEILQEKFLAGNVKDKVKCGFDAVAEYQCIHNLLENGVELEPMFMKQYEHLCDTFGFERFKPVDSSTQLIARINLITEELSQSNRELIAEYVIRTGNFKKAEEYAKNMEKEPGITKKLLQELRLVDSYKYMLWTIAEYENNNAVQPSERITKGAYNSSAIPVLSDNVHSLSQINQSFLLVRKHASPESVKYYAIVEEQDGFRIAYVTLNEYQPETAYSTVAFADYREAEEFYNRYLETPNSRLVSETEVGTLAAMESKGNLIALSDITSIGKTLASQKHMYEESGIGEEEALDMLRSEIRGRYPENGTAERTETNDGLQILKDFKKVVSSYGKEHFIELCNLHFYDHARQSERTDVAIMEEALQLTSQIREQRNQLESMEIAGIDDVKECMDNILDCTATSTGLEKAFNAIDSAVLSAEFEGLEAEFEGFEEYNNVLDTLKAAQVMPDKFCYVDYSASPAPYVYTSDPAGNIYKKSLQKEWNGSVQDLHTGLKESGYEICTNMDDFRAYSANNRIAVNGGSEKEKSRAYIRVLESTSDMFPKNEVFSIYEFKNSMDKLSSDTTDFQENITYKLVTREDQEIHSYIDAYTGNSGQSVYEQLYDKAKGQNPELSRVISKQYYQDQINFNDEHLIKPLLKELKQQQKAVSDSDELTALIGSNDKLREEIKKLDLSPADAELLKLNAGNIQAERIADINQQMQMNQQAQKQRLRSQKPAEGIAV